MSNSSFLRSSECSGCSWTFCFSIISVMDSRTKQTWSRTRFSLLLCVGGSNDITRCASSRPRAFLRDVRSDLEEEEGIAADEEPPTVQTEDERRKRERGHPGGSDTRM